MNTDPTAELREHLEAWIDYLANPPTARSVERMHDLDMAPGKRAGLLRAAIATLDEAKRLREALRRLLSLSHGWPQDQLEHIAKGAFSNPDMRRQHAELILAARAALSTPAQEAPDAG